MKGDEVILLCPKKLEQNWKQYIKKHNSIFEVDKLDYDVKFHTDLRIGGFNDNFLQYLLNDKGYGIRNTTYLERVQFEVEVLLGQQDLFYQWIIENTNAEVSVKEGDYTLISVLL